MFGFFSVCPPDASSNTSTVFLRGKTSTDFIGFMLEAREQGRVDEGRPVGKFILLEPDNTQLLTCEGMSVSTYSINHY